MASVYIYDLETEKLGCLNRLCKFAQNNQNTIAIKEVAYLTYINVKGWNQGGYVLFRKQLNSHRQIYPLSPTHPSPQAFIHSFQTDLTGMQANGQAAWLTESQSGVFKNVVTSRSSLTLPSLLLQKQMLRQSGERGVYSRKDKSKWLTGRKWRWHLQIGTSYKQTRGLSFNYQDYKLQWAIYLGWSPAWSLELCLNFSSN